MNRIKKIRKKLGISQSFLAQYANISQPYLSDLENGRRGAKPETIERIAIVLGVDVSELKV